MGTVTNNGIPNENIRNEDNCQKFQGNTVTIINGLSLNTVITYDPVKYHVIKHPIRLSISVAFFPEMITDPPTSTDNLGPTLNP